MPIYGVPLILPCVKHGAGLLQRTFEYASLLRISGALHLPACAKPRLAGRKAGAFLISL
jgi:hypothetical protein